MAVKRGEENFVTKVLVSIRRPAILAVMKHTNVPARNPRNATWNDDDDYIINSP